MKERDITYWRGRCENVERAVVEYMNACPADPDETTAFYAAGLGLIEAMHDHDEDQWEKHAERERARHRSEEPRGAPFDEDLGGKEGA